MVVGEFVRETSLVVVGGGVGGWAAALRAAELDTETIVVSPHGLGPDRDATARTAIRNAAGMIQRAQAAQALGVGPAPALDPAKLRRLLAEELESTAKDLERRCGDAGVEVIEGVPRFESRREISAHDGAKVRLRFRRAVIAPGSTRRPLPAAGWPRRSR